MFRGMIKTLRLLTVRQKLIFTICGGTIMTILLTSAIIFRHVSRLSARELIRNGTIIASSLSKQSIDPILHDDVWELYRSINSLTGDAGMQQGVDTQEQNRALVRLGQGEDALHHRGRGLVPG